jgi:hypothetical protein
VIDALSNAFLKTIVGVVASLWCVRTRACRASVEKKAKGTNEGATQQNVKELCIRIGNSPGRNSEVRS